MATNQVYYKVMWSSHVMENKETAELLAYYGAPFVLDYSDGETTAIFVKANDVAAVRKLLDNICIIEEYVSDGGRQRL